MWPKGSLPRPHYLSLLPLPISHNQISFSFGHLLTLPALIMDNPPLLEPVSTLRNTTTEYDKHSSTSLSAADAHKGVAKDMAGCSIGPMPIQEFLDRFMPDHKKKPLGEIDANFFESIPGSGHETKRYLPFVSHRDSSLPVPTILISLIDASRSS